MGYCPSSASCVSCQRATARIYCCGAVLLDAQRPAAIDRYLLYPPGTQQQTRRTLLQRSLDGTDRPTDGHRTVTQTLLGVLRGHWQNN